MSEQGNESVEADIDDQDAEPASAPTGAAAEEPEDGDQDAGPASAPTR
jgi:hypothetical protein